MFCHAANRCSAARVFADNRMLGITVGTWFALGCFWAAYSSNICAQENTVQVSTVSGAIIEGVIRSGDAQSVTLQTGIELKKLPFEQLEAISFGVAGVLPSQPIVLIELMDGSMLNTKTVSILSRKLQIGLNSGGGLILDTRDVKSIRFKTYESQPEFGKQWQKILADNVRKSDAIVISRNRELGTIEGMVGDLIDGKLGFSIEARSARVPVSKLEAILFYHASGRESAAPVCEVILADNSRFFARELDWNGERLGITFACGATAEIPFKQLAKVNYSLGRTVYLSSIEPTTNDWQPLITSAAIFEDLRKMKLARPNQSFSGRPLTLAFHAETGASHLSEIKQFENGFAIQGGGKLAFQLGGQYENLSGHVGFDPYANASGNVLFRVLLDGKIVMQQELIHRLIKQPVEIDLNVHGVDRVVIQVQYNDGRSTGDQIHLVELKVTR